MVTAKPRGRPFKKGQSGNPGGRPKGERDYLVQRHGEDARDLHERLDKLADDKDSPAGVRATILMWKVERHSGKAPATLGDLPLDRGPVTIIYKLRGADAGNRA